MRTDGKAGLDSAIGVSGCAGRIVDMVSGSRGSERD